MGLTGEPERPPVKVGPAITDVVTSYLGGFAICAALLVRNRDGIGQKISLNLLDSGVSVSPNYAAQYLRQRTLIRPMGGAHPQIVPYQVFASSDGHMVVACISERFWPLLCQALGRPELAGDPRYATNVDRVHNRDELVGILSRIFAEQTTNRWIDLLQTHDVPCSPVNRLEDVFADPQVQHNGMVIELEHPTIGAYQALGNPIRMSASPPNPGRHAPQLGENTEEVLLELGYSTDEIDALEHAGSIVRTRAKAAVKPRTE
jgi:crotonobetainyl-CoA:carnitine CoA-transferase CaiB-like acyl-CoA transferase